MQKTYSYNTRIGNWYEDMVLQDEKMREFLEKKEKGTLTIQRIRQNVATISMPTPSPDGLLHYNYPVRIVNFGLDSYLSCDPGDLENDTEQWYSATGSRSAEVTPRNVWVLIKVDEVTGQPIETDDVVCYGDQFFICTTESLASDRYYIGSHVPDWTHFSRESRKQVVYSTQNKSYFNAWKVESIGRDTMMEMEGEVIKYGECVCLLHCSTCAPLGLTEKIVFNDYGNEYETVAHKIPGRNNIWYFSEK